MNTDYLFDDPLAIDDYDDFYYGEDSISDTDVLDSVSDQFMIKINRIADGATTLIMAADSLRAYADLLESYDEDGYELSSPIEDGQAFAYLYNNEGE